MGVLRRVLEPSGYITTWLNVQVFDILPTECIYVFYINLRTKAVISQHSINWMIFITQTEFVYYAVRTELSDII